MSAQSKDTVYLAIGGVAFAAATAWAFLLKTDQSSFNVPSSGRDYEPVDLKIEAPVSRQWAEAPSQSAGDKWLFEVFTPPQIFYNQETKQFTVIPPVRAVAPAQKVAEVVKPEFGLKLAKVEQPLFRLQLVGAVNFGPDARGTFENQLTKDIVIGSKGRRIADLNLEIIEFVAERRRAQVQGGSDVVTDVIYAVVRDTQTGVETRLDSRTRLPEGPLKATLLAADGTERVVQAGETLKEGEATFQILDLKLEPQAVTAKKITPEAPEGVTEVLVIAAPTPPPAPAPSAAEPGTAPSGNTLFPGF